jgi:hypothetical protein
MPASDRPGVSSPSAGAWCGAKLGVPTAPRASLERAYVFSKNWYEYAFTPQARTPCLWMTCFDTAATMSVASSHGMG